MKSFLKPAAHRMVTLLLAALFWALAGCNLSETKTEGISGNSESITLMTWNLHNLFDGKDDGTEYDEYRESAGWTKEKYRGRINAINAAIEKIEPRPDVIIVQEIENSQVLDDIADSFTGRFWNHFANNPGAALGLGIISRFPLEVRAHSITINTDTTPRPVLEARIQTKTEEFVVFACHWKSKLGGDDVTENVRRASARVILRRIRELWETEPDLGIIVAGDLNENHDEFFRQGAAKICALLPDDPYCALLSGYSGADVQSYANRQNDFLIISKNSPPAARHFPGESIVFYSPWTSDLENGSYYYKRNWETIDHFLLTKQFFNNTGWDYEKAEVVNYQPFGNANGIPVSYSIRTGAGLSDHLPLLITLKMNSD
ncbi:MAG: endonuclease/exonuclease/phosphatase family protein [Treponema sp.]|jgi:endonuclease/exonuclease/phosphatase family metal-dependent hydrolase|nr:endonuclease/exonuclease/phosphatase family protein [Treponema sp.]